MKIFSNFLKACAATLILTACSTPAGGPATAMKLSRVALPPMKTFAPARPAPSNRSNASIAQEFIELNFNLESGRRLPVLSRFEGPITLRVTGKPMGPNGDRDLNQLLARLRNEAHIPITRVAANQHANITVQVVSRRTLHRAVPQAACFVSPGIESLAEYKHNRRTAQQDWVQIAQRHKIAVFLPNDTGPQEFRTCLHEEIAQALGPLNDLYHLSDSVFNDDDFHSILTSFDMLVLRALYDPALHSGMTKHQTAAALPAILARINPRGRSGGFSSSSPTTPAWVSAISAALNPQGDRISRLNGAKSAVSIAQKQNWNDNRLGFSYYVLGRNALSTDARLALTAFAQAEAVFGSSPNTRLHAANVAAQAAAFALSTGDPAHAIDIVDANSTTALTYQDARLLAALLMIKAQALDALDRRPQADTVRLDSLGWARYGFGSDADIRRHLGDIAAIDPL
ncbi:MAG: DUF2927 domain-containing protein [Paracoccaceae bacterium]